MNERQVIDVANNVAMQRLLERYLANRQQYATRGIAGATVIVEPSRHRTGIPADAACRRYIFTNVGEGWSVVARAVWRDGRLLQPGGTHTQIDIYFDDDGRYGDDEAAVAVAFNAWLQSLDL